MQRKWRLLVGKSALSYTMVARNRYNAVFLL